MSQAGEEYAEQLQYVAAGRAKARSLRPLRDLLPFLRPYAGRIALATAALICSSAASLVIPPAIGRMIDHGFTAQMAAQIGNYFFVIVALAAALAVFTAVRFYFVTWIGERVVADIRKAVFNHVIGLTPAFFEVTRTGEVLSRLTADTTLIQTVSALRRRSPRAMPSC